MPLSTDPLISHEAFTPLTGTPFRARQIEPAIDLTLTAVTLSTHPTARTTPGFSLYFRGPLTPLLPQGTYTLEHATLGALDIFIVPIKREADGLLYEAVFN
jgi:hypothetical protein